MKIGYLIGAGALGSGWHCGVLQQALAYREALAKRGVVVTLLNPWEGEKVGSYDLIHAFGGGAGLSFLINQAGKYKTRYVVSPIIDSTNPNWLYRLYSHIRVKKLLMGTPGYMNRQILNMASEVWVRSLHEGDKVENGLGVPAAKIRKVPVCLRIPPDHLVHDGEREEACLHVSSFYQPHKNVHRLVEATGRLGVKLYLGGNTTEQFQRSEAYRKIREKSHVVILGRLSEEELLDYYSKVRIFALPSHFEGVGLVAVEAGVSGAGIVISRNGGPPDYFGDMGYYVDPYSVHSIQEAIAGAIHNPHQPELRNYLLKHYSQESVGEQLEKGYLEVMR